MHKFRIDDMKSTRNSIMLMYSYTGDAKYPYLVLGCFTRMLVLVTRIKMGVLDFIACMYVSTCL